MENGRSGRIPEWGVFGENEETVVVTPDVIVSKYFVVSRNAMESLFDDVERVYNALVNLDWKVLEEYGFVRNKRVEIQHYGPSHSSINYVDLPEKYILEVNGYKYYYGAREYLGVYDDVFVKFMVLNMIDKRIITYIYEDLIGGKVQVAFFNTENESLDNVIKDYKPGKYINLAKKYFNLDNITKKVYFSMHSSGNEVFFTIHVMDGKRDTNFVGKITDEGILLEMWGCIEGVYSILVKPPFDLSAKSLKDVRVVRIVKEFMRTKVEKSENIVDLDFNGYEKELIYTLKSGMEVYYPARGPVTFVHDGVALEMPKRAKKTIAKIIENDDVAAVRGWW